MSSSKAVVLKNPSSGSVAITSSQRVKKGPVKKALEEEEFTESLKTIIRRDFFPDVPKLEAQLEFIEASESNDYDKLREISERFTTTTHTPAPPPATPSTFETPVSTPQSKRKLKHKEPTTEETNETNGPSDAKKQKLEDGKSLDQFLSKYQSEDDASFGEIMDKAAEEHRLKHVWLYAKEQEYNQNALEGSSQPLAITDGSTDDQSNSQLMIESRPAGLNSWNYTAKNTLMYIPDGVEQSSKELVEGASKGREIVHSNTRLSTEFVRKTQAKLAKASGEEETGNSAKGKTDKIGVDGRILAPSATPSVNGYGFVATPQIHPGVDASPLMTWGSIDGTPFRLDTDVTPSSGPAFKMPKIPKREELAFKLAEKSANANRERKKAAILAASPALLRQKLGASPSTVDRYQLLSPAARKLVARTTPRGTDKALKASYTPQRTPVIGGTPQSTTRAGVTPKHKTVGGSTTPSLTDNLLNLNKR